MIGEMRSALRLRRSWQLRRWRESSGVMARRTLAFGCSALSVALYQHGLACGAIRACIVAGRPHLAWGPRIGSNAFPTPANSASTSAVCVALVWAKHTALARTALSRPTAVVADRAPNSAVSYRRRRPADHCRLPARSAGSCIPVIDCVSHEADHRRLQVAQASWSASSLRPRSVLAALTALRSARFVNRLCQAPIGSTRDAPTRAASAPCQHRAGTGKTDCLCLEVLACERQQSMLSFDHDECR